MKQNDRYNLLYNQLWLANKQKLMKINPELKNNLQVESIDLSKNIVIQSVKTVKSSVSLALNNTPLAKQNTPQIKTNVANKTPSKTMESINIPTNRTMVTGSVANLGWDDLSLTIKECTKCVLCKGRTQVVIERGNRNADWMFIGEGPGEQEDLQGKPFVGASGKLLDKMIAAMKLKHDSDVYICNVVKCRPPQNRNPEPDEINACKDYLLRQIELVQPKIIIALGRFASQTLLDSTLATGKLRGQVHQFKTIPLVVTYHPSYLLRNSNAKKDAWADLQLAMRVFQ